MNWKKLRRIVSWHIACVLDWFKWQYTIAAGLVLSWATLICAIDSPLHADTQLMTSRLAPHVAFERAKPRSAKLDSSAPRDLARDFAASLPEFKEHIAQLRALNSLAEKNGVVITRIDYRYEQLPALPIRKLALRMDVRGDEAQQQSFLRTTLNTFPNLSVARLAYAKNADGAAKLDQKLDLNLYYRLLPKAAS
ncbi:hypothetical protein SBC1_56140 (plasmid) [Caballeronia sp. SBC1]|uniref:hypothetical protein n=1 Tax=unclassified Caballeronia TaxID=2646786 RepID=UPI0013E1155B|nr:MULTISPECIES: hypothetical protein [unclassified Caballeronia]QIE27508.1 hypothetical protein SBC2_55820 [Caballeronia sp. SBC2]QIN65569.1 hypothetical protein SBC1_56140 [Caballeronia sp. SBC1]